MIKLKLKPIQNYIDNSTEIEINPKKNYSSSIKVTGFSGKPNCAYFGVVYLDENGMEIDRKIKWLNDFSGVEKTIELIFHPKTSKILFIYRINFETKLVSDLQYIITPIKDTKFKEISDSIMENSDSIDYQPELRDELSPNEENNLEKNLVWIFGFARSGTSWLGLELLSFNTNSINELHIDKHLGVREEFITDKFVRRYDHMKKISSYFFSDKFKKTWIFYLRKLILNRIYAEVPDFSKKIILKEPGGDLGSFDIVSQCLQKSRFIILLRDGRDVLDSFVDARQKDGFMSAFGETPVTSENKMEYIRYHSEIWTSYMENLMNFSNLPSGSVYFIKYEDLIKNTLEELKKIYEFLEINISNEEIQKIVENFDFKKIPDDQKGSGKFHRSASPGKWKENFTEEELKLMNSIMGKTLLKLNYF